MTPSSDRPRDRGDLAERRRQARARAAARRAEEDPDAAAGEGYADTVTTRYGRKGRGVSGMAHPRRRWLTITLAALAIVVVSGAAFAWATVGRLSHGLPDLGDINAVATFQTTRIYDTSKPPKLLASLAGSGNRVIIPDEQIPKRLSQAVVAIEDRRFYSHPAIDPWGIARAVWTNVVRRSVVQGGSTITQQYVKNAYFSPRRTLERKVKEAFLAYQLERKYSKDQILAKYLNTIYFGEGAYGVEAASQTYFARHARQLNLPQAAMLAALIRSPARYSPFNHPDAAKERRKLVLEHMASEGYITAQQADAAAETSLPTAKTAMQRGGIAPYFIDHVVQRLVQLVGEQAAYSGGLRVYTTLDLGLQKTAEDAVNAELDKPSDPSAALVSLDPHTGAVRAMVGGRDYRTQQYNVATQGHRQPGSSFKTFVLATAIDRGISPDQYFDSDSPVTFDVTGSAPWKVSNYEGSGNGYIPLTDATARSVNAAYANVMMQVGPDKVVQTAKAMGITTPLNRDPAIALGGLREGVNPLEMASAYGTLADGGIRVPPYSIERIVDGEGQAVRVKRAQKRRALLPAVAALVTQALKGVIDGGTGVSADIGRPEAGKTGTAQNYQDAWFVGYVPQMSTAVWVGYPKGQIPMRDVHGIKVTGGSFPARIWARFMEKALAGEKELDFAAPPDGSIVYREIDPVTGYLATQYCPETVEAVYVKGRQPTELCPVHEQLLVPKVVGLTLDGAQAKLKDIGMDSSATVVGSSAPKGQVVGQSPAAGAKGKRGRVVKLDVSDGKGVAPSGSATQTVVPTVVGLSVDAARAALTKAGLHSSVAYASSKKPRDQVISSNPQAGAHVSLGATVVLTVSAGEAVTVPNVVGARQVVATTRLESAGFVVVVESATTDESKGHAVGSIVRQSPSGGSLAPKASTVVIYVARK